MAHDEAAAFEAGAYLVTRAEKVSDRVLQAASFAMAKKVRPSYDHPLEVDSDEAAQYVISRLKRRLRDYDRDPISAVELSRLYTCQGQSDSAIKAMDLAVALAPNSRFVLRAATRLFTMLTNSERALWLLRRSDATLGDPWLQSAEIATSELANVASRFAGRAKAMVHGDDKIPGALSELALAVATLEEKSGVRRGKVLRLVEAALGSATENALAQAVWLTENTGLRFGEKFPDIELPRDAFEAKALDAYDEGNFIESEKQCHSWVRDQPFQARGPIMLANINTVHFERYETASRVAEEALIMHPKDWGVINIACISRALNGDVLKSKEHLAKLRTVCDTDVSKVFYEAARGLIAFAENDFVGGRKFYKSSFDKARKIGRNDLMMIAGMYYIEREAKAGLADERDIIEFVKHIDKIVNKSQYKSDGTYRIWQSRRKIIDKYLVDWYNINRDPIAIAEDKQLALFPTD